MKKYLLQLFILTAALALLILFLPLNFESWQKAICWYVLGYFFVITYLSHLGLYRATQQRPQVFVRYYMASTSIRLLAHLVVIISYSMFNQPHAKFFIITFMIMYFVFTIFEIGYVMKNKFKL